MKFYTDRSSEKYRKYIIKVIFSPGESYYLLWETNLQNGDMDYIMLDNSDRMLAFIRLNDLVQYVKKNENIIDAATTKEWAQNYKNRRPYCIYPIDSIYEMLQSGFELSSIGKENADCLLGFYNLFSDYARQLDDKLLMRMVREKNTACFAEFFHTKFFWDATGQERKLDKMDKAFVFLKFKNNYLKMLSVFKERLSIWK